MEFTTYVYNLLPTNEQKDLLQQMLNQQDEVYNSLIEFAAMQYAVGRQDGEVKAQVMGAVLAPWLSAKSVKTIKMRVCRQIDRMACGQIRVLCKSSPYQKNRTIEFPAVNLYGRYVEIPFVGRVLMNMHRPLLGCARIYSVVIREYLYGSAYEISFRLAYEMEGPVPGRISGGRAIGLDYKQDGLFVDSNGNSGEYPGFIRAGRTKVNDLYRTAARFKVGSSRWLKFMRRAAKLELHMQNQRKNWQFKQAARLANENDVVCVETLDLREMREKNASLALKIYDNNWPGFKAKLKRKLDQQGKPLVEVPKYYPSSQICHNCGYRFGKIPLAQRYIWCPNCSCGMDRDINAACNIRDEGIRMLPAA